MISIKGLSGSKLLKVNDIEISNSIAENITISSLNHDCLRNIFEYLSVPERYIVSFVCKSWNSLIDNSWSDVKNLNINKKLRNEYSKINFSCPKKITSFVIQILKNCGTCLTTVKIRNSKEFDMLTILKEIAKNCKNIISFDFDRGYVEFGFHSDDSGYDDAIEQIFKNNVKIQKVSLEDLNIVGKCLSKLEAPNIDKLELNHCKFKSFNFLSAFMSQLKNLKFLKLFASFDTKLIEVALKELNISNCQSLIHLEVISSSGFKNDDYSTLLSKQNNLKILNTDDIDMGVIPKDSLEKINIDIRIYTIKFLCFHKFQNLKIVHCKVQKFTDIIVKQLTKCKQLKKLSFNIKKYSLTEDGEGYFKRFEGLEDLKIYIDLYAPIDGNDNNIRGQNIDNLLMNISKCKNLKKLDISECIFTKKGLKALGSLPSLTDLDVTFTSTSNSGLIYLVKKSSKLEKLDVTSCGGVTNKFLEEANEVKSKRNDTKQLIVNTACSSFIDIERLKGIYPMILLTTEDRYRRLLEDNE